MPAANWFPDTVGTHFAGKEIAKACPDCGGWMELVKAEEGGRIEEPYFPKYPIRGAELPRSSRPASFWACSSCEHCEEVA